MYSVERKAEIISTLESTGTVDVSDLAVRFKTSRETIRRDLRELEANGIIKRTHGGAVLAERHNSIQKPQEYPVAVRGIQRFNEKNEICKKAASFIQNGDIIFVDNSSTTMYLSKHIPAGIQVTFITNSIKFLLECSQNPNSNILLICLGGIFKGDNLSVYGNATLKSAEEYYPNKAFLSCAAISTGAMLADTSIHEIDTKRMMIERAQEVFILADHTKFGKNGPIFLSTADAVDCLITDSKTDISALSALSQKNVKIIAAESDESALTE